MTNSPETHNEVIDAPNRLGAHAWSIPQVANASGYETARPVAPRQLPLAVPGFTGRTEHLAALDALLSNDNVGAGAVVISALDGTAGVGKTTLAVHWAHRVQHRFPDVDEAITTLRPLADNADDREAAYRLVDLLAKHGRIDELTRRADAGDKNADHHLAILLAGQGRVDEAITMLRPHTNNFDGFVARELVNLLTKYGRLDELAAEVAAGTRGAAAALRAARSDLPAAVKQVHRERMPPADQLDDPDRRAALSVKDAIEFRSKPPGHRHP